jgi:hypothetical protein
VSAGGGGGVGVGPGQRCADQPRQVHEYSWCCPLFL